MQIIRWVALIGTCLAGVLLFVVVVSAGIAAWVLYSSKPDYNGSDNIAGLTGDVSVIRDSNAVPHIFANTLADGYRALGYLHAQDRFFQMDFARRLAAGTLAEFAGASALRSDRFMRTLGLYRAARAASEAAEPATRTAIEAYTQGVNAWLGSARFRRPPELTLGASQAEPWRPADSLAIGRLMALLLSGNWRDELLRAELATRLTRDQIADLWPSAPAGSPATIPDLSLIFRTLAPAAIAAAVPNLYPAASASNAWVVDGRYTTTGKPLLANDPHLGFSAPGWWYLARLVTPEGIRVGATLAGQPFIVIGHNSRVAWGLTTTHADSQDLFVEKIDPADPNRYLIPDGSRAFDTRTEIISVRFQSTPETLTIRESRHGPIVSDIAPEAQRGTPEGHVLALSWPALRHDDRTADAFAGMNAAHDASAFAAALRRFDSPMQNVTFADVDGVAGFYAAGRVPIRKSGDGSRPVPGWSGEYDWSGFVPFDALPHAIAPLKGRIVNANNRIVGENYPFLLTANWPEAYRARRIHDLLDRNRKHTSATFSALQNDIQSYAAQDLLPVMLDLAHGGRPANPQASALLAELAQWNGTMSRDRREPLIFWAWVRELSRLLYRDELGESFGRLHGPKPEVVKRMLTTQQIWCDNTETSVQEDCAAIVTRALDAGIDLLRNRLGDNSMNWRWGSLHKAAFRHPVIGRIPVLRNIFGTIIETDGGPFTINRGTARLSGERDLFAHIHGPGLRAVFDLANLDASLFMIASGQSGHPLSSNYTDTTNSWREGGTFTLTGDAVALRPDARGVMRLTP